MKKWIVEIHNSDYYNIPVYAESESEAERLAKEKLKLGLDTDEARDWYDGNGLDVVSLMTDD